MAPIQIVNDTIVPLGKQPADFSPHEIAVGDAMFLLTLVLPALGASLVLLTRDGWWKQNQRLSFQTVAAIWLVSNTFVGINVRAQGGVTSRKTFVLAAFHEQIEYLLISILLGFSARRCFIIVWLAALFTFGAILLLPSLRTAYIIVAIVGGTTDAIIPMLLLYGKQYLLGAAGLFHLSAAGAVFFQVVRNMGIVTYNQILFFAVWGQVGFVVAGVVELSQKYHEGGDKFPNPLDGVNISRAVLLRIVVTALLAATGLTLFYAFVLPNL